MKNTLWLSLTIAAVLGCNSPQKENSSTSTAYGYPDVIPIDTANKMINSYLNSIQYSQNDTDLQSITFDARLLRKYLDNMEDSDEIVGLKIMFAHTLEYINSGKDNQYAGYRSGALTFIIAGYNANGDYVYFNNDLVIDNGMPCPTHCPPGNADSRNFPTSNR